MKKIPTDLELLTAIYERYYDVFASYSEDDKTRVSKAYVPIDLIKVAKDVDSDEFLVFGRLYNFLERKHGYKNDDGSNVHLFALKVRDDVNCIHFPLLSSVLAELQLENKKHQRAIILSTISTVVSILSLLIALTSLFINLNKK